MLLRPKNIFQDHECRLTISKVCKFSFSIAILKNDKYLWDCNDLSSGSNFCVVTCCRYLSTKDKTIYKRGMSTFLHIKASNLPLVRPSQITVSGSVEMHLIIHSPEVKKSCNTACIINL